MFPADELFVENTSTDNQEDEEELKPLIGGDDSFPDEPEESDF